MKKLVTILLAALLLTACGSPGSPANDEGKLKEYVRPTTVELNDGRSVECVVFWARQEGGLWCTPSSEEINP